MEIIISESQLKAITEATKLDEAKSIKSKKLQDIFRQHGGLKKHRFNYHTRTYATTDLHNMQDNNILGVINREQLRQIQSGHDVDHWRWADNYGLDHWAKNKGVELQRGDRVESLELADGMFLIYVERNAEFEHSGREGGFKDFYNKRQNREKSQRKTRDFNGMTPTAKAARELRNNPYFWADKGDKSKMQTGWANPDVRKKAMDNARKGLDAHGLAMQ
jgi:hypothetical protein